MGSVGTPDYDVLVIGAGLSGIFAVYRIREIGLTVKCLESGSGEGGTWYWNQYPGCRFDSESYSYGFSYWQEVLKEWNWTEHFAPGHETLQYAQFLTDKFDLRQHMQFDTKIKSAHYQEATRTWILTDENQNTYTSRFILTALGILSDPTLPVIPGVEDFEREAYHTSRWPKNYTLSNKRVGIIGVGATGIQIIQEIVKWDIQSLTVFQRTPNWSAPLHNGSINKEEMDDIRQKYPEIHESCATSAAGFIHVADERRFWDVSKEDRLALYEELYAKPGFGKWLSNFADIHFDREANAEYSEFIAKKIRERVKDPKTAEKLIPNCHGFGTRRVPLESGYFEAYNHENVRLVDVKNEDPIERVTKTGILLESGEHIELDVLIYATGFDAITGAFSAIDFRGENGIKLTDVWSEGPRTFLGLFVHRFPNMMMIMGPHQMFGNFPRSIEFAVLWTSTFIEFCARNNIAYADAPQSKVDEWTQHVFDCAKGLLANEVDSWMTGVNKNVKSKQKRIIARYNGPAPGYWKRCLDVSGRNYEDLRLRRNETSESLQKDIDHEGDGRQIPRL